MKSIAQAAALGVAFVFTLSCGEHNFEEWEDLIFGKSSSSERSSSSEHNWEEEMEEDEPVIDEDSSSSNVVVTSSSSSSRPSSSSAPPQSSSSSSRPSSSSAPPQSSSSFRLGSSCEINGETVDIGEQVWMVENLNCDVAGSVCYDNNESNCTKYGRLYDWATAMDVCPPNWHIPSAAEWSTLINYVESNRGCSNCAGRYLKTSSGWNEGGNGTDSFGFSALPSGASNLSGNFYGIGYNGHWWSREGSIHAYIQIMFYNHDVAYWHDYNKSNLFSVRCVKD